MDMQDIKDEWGNGKIWIDSFTRDFPTLEGLADGIPASNQKEAPRVGVVTIANSVRQIPRSSVQQAPVLSCQINGTKLSVDSLVGTFILKSVVFSPDTFGNGILSTMQMGAQTALTTGFVALRANVGKIFNKFSTMLETLHYNDIVIEPGVFDASNSSYYHVRTRVTKGALTQLIKDATANPDTAWNVGALQRLLDAGPQAFNFNPYLPASRQNASLGMEAQFDICTRYGVGPYYSIDVYSPQLTDSDDDMLMSIKSKSKFGFPRVSLLVIDPAQLSPFGISRARLASPMAAYGNIYLQSTAKMQLLNSDAPVLKTGLFTGPTPLKRGVQWESLDPNARAEIMELSNSTLEQFTNIMNYVDTNILNVMGVTGVGPQQAAASTYQNTAQTAAINSVTTLSSAQVTSIIENAIRQYGLTALDLYISEQEGETLLIVDDDTKNAINNLFPLQAGEAPFVGDDNSVKIDWEQYYERINTLTVSVDLSITPDQLAEKNQDNLQDTFTVMKQTAAGDPQAEANANALGQELVQQIAPDVANKTNSLPTTAPVQPPTNMPAVGGQPAGV